MPKVYTKRAAKDYPDSGIKKGDTYYCWAFYKQKERKSTTYPNRIQLTRNETLLAVYGVFDGDVPAESSDLDDRISELEDAASELQSKFDSLPEGFQQADQGQTMEAWIDAIGTAVSELEDLKSEMETAEEEQTLADDQQYEYDFDVAERFGAAEPDLS